MCAAMSRIRLALAGFALLWASGANAVECRDLSHDGNRYSICTVDMAKDDLRLFLKDETGSNYGHFGNIDTALRPQGKRLAFAMNAGMYHKDRSPVGHYSENGAEEQRLITSDGPGNFGLLPNGVFCIRPGRADVIETKRFAQQKPECSFATQSGPMLVIDDKLHPRFLPDSTSRYIRNGVGTTSDGTLAIFAISGNAVTFHEFGRLFRDVLKLPQALYFDGNISRLYAPTLGRSDAGFALGPIVGVVASE